MARQKGLMKYVGTIGDVRHFKIKGQEGFFAGMVGGPTAEQVNSAPEFERTRENMNEFGGCAKVGKSLRTALSALMGKFTDPQVTGRLTSIMKKINLEDGTEPDKHQTVYGSLCGFGKVVMVERRIVLIKCLCHLQTDIVYIIEETVINTLVASSEKFELFCLSFWLRKIFDKFGEIACVDGFAGKEPIEL